MHGVARKARSYDGFWICLRAVMSRQSLIAAGPQPHPFDRQELPLAVLEIQVSGREGGPFARAITRTRSEEHTSELQSLMRISYAVFCLKKKTTKSNIQYNQKKNSQKTETRQQLN